MHQLVLELSSLVDRNWYFFFFNFNKLYQLIKIIEKSFKQMDQFQIK